MAGQENNHMIQKLTRTAEEVLAFFFRHPTGEIHIRGLSDAANIPYSSVRNALQELDERGLVAKREESKMTFYTANRDDSVFRRRKRLHNLQVLYDSGVVDVLEGTFRPDAIVLFGSYLEGADREDSDVDIAVVNGRDADVDLGEYEAEIGRAFQVVQTSDPTEEEPEFRNTLANGYLLAGYLEVVKR